MAIAYGNAKTSFGSSSLTGPAVSGSDTIGFLINTGDVAADNLTGVTWGGIAMTKIAAVKIPSDRWLSGWYIVNPSSSDAITLTGGSFFHGYVDYWTGANQSGQPDSFNTNTANSGGTTIATSTTVVASNCWLIYAVTDGAGGITYSTSLGIMRQSSTDGSGAPAYGDSNATVSTGSQSVTLTAGSGTSARAMILFSLAPSGGAVATLAAHRALQGVGL